MKKNTAFLKLLLYSVCYLMVYTANAQKLPNIQVKSLRAPANVRIDGRITEWGDELQAYNKSTNIFYTIAHDDRNLYLVVKATDHDIIRKIASAGISFTINGSGKKSEIGGLAITYPSYEKKSKAIFLDLWGISELDRENTAQIDSFVDTRNKILSQHLKSIAISGFTEIADGEISIYNEQGIKAASLIDNKIEYNYEISIPLKYLDIKDGMPLVNYNIKLNGTTLGATNIQVNTGGRDIITYTGADGVHYQAGALTPDNIAIAFPTDFSGQYNFAEK